MAGRGRGMIKKKIIIIKKKKRINESRFTENHTTME